MDYEDGGYYIVMGFFRDLWDDFGDLWDDFTSYTSPEKMELLNKPYENFELASMFDSKEVWDCIFNIRDGNDCRGCSGCNNNLVKNDAEEQIVENEAEQEKETVHVKKRSKEKEKKVYL